MAQIVNSISNMAARKILLSTLLTLVFFGSVMPAAALMLSPDSERALKTAERQLLDGDFRLAHKTFSELAEKGHDWSNFYLAQIYRYPTSPFKDEAQAKQFAFKAAEAGVKEAAFWLARWISRDANFADARTDVRSSAERLTPLVNDLVSADNGEAVSAALALIAILHGEDLDAGVDADLWRRLFSSHQRYLNDESFEDVIGYAPLIAGIYLSALRSPHDGSFEVKGMRLSYLTLLPEARNGSIRALGSLAGYLDDFARIALADEQAYATAMSSEDVDFLTDLQKNQVFWLFFAAKQQIDGAHEALKLVDRGVLDLFVRDAIKETEGAIELETDFFRQRYREAFNWCRVNVDEKDDLVFESCRIFAAENDERCLLELNISDPHRASRSSDLYSSCRWEWIKER